MKKFVSTTTLAIFALLPTSTFAVTAYDSPSVSIKDPGSIDLVTVINKLITWVLLLVGGIAILFIIWGGFQYITSSGNKDKAEAAKQTLTYAVIGLVVIVLAKVIVNLVTNTAATALF